MQTFETLYKRTATGAVQIWYQEVEGDSWRSVSGQIDGLKVTSEWHKCEGKNTGKRNGTTAEEQAVKEVEANYTKRLKLGYFKSLSDIDGEIYFKPMLAKKYDDYAGKINFKHPVYTQPKLDGMRCVATVNGLFSRTGEKIVTCPHVHEELIKLGAWDRDELLVYDGEIYNHQFKENFEELMSLARKSKPTSDDLVESSKFLQFHVYDIYTSDEMLFCDRIKIAASVKSDIIVPVPTYLVSSQDELDNLNGEFIESGYEGQMIRLNGTYENKRSKYLLKRKEFDTNEFDIVDIKEGVGNRSGMAGFIACRMKDGKLFDAGIKGSHDYAKKLLQNKHLYVGNKSDVTVRHFGYTVYGLPRFPVAVYLYEGKRTV